LTEGCIKGIIRKKIIEMIQKNGEYILRESEISPFELQKADALFITNTVVEIQGVTKYRKKLYNHTIVEKMITDFSEYKNNLS
jgi:branched-chain amino acid aminotransferase